MCVNRDNVTDEELERFHNFFNTLDPERPLTALLGTIGAMIEGGASICFAHNGDEQEAAELPPPGIYPPGAFSPGQQFPPPPPLSGPEPGTGQYL